MLKLRNRKSSRVQYQPKPLVTMLLRKKKLLTRRQMDQKMKKKHLKKKLPSLWALKDSNRAEKKILRR